MKRFLLNLLAALLVVVFAGPMAACGPDNDGPKPASKETITYKCDKCKATKDVGVGDDAPDCEKCEKTMRRR